MSTLAHGFASARIRASQSFALIVFIIAFSHGSFAASQLCEEKTITRTETVALTRDSREARVALDVLVSRDDVVAASLSAKARGNFGGSDAAAKWAEVTTSGGASLRCEGGEASQCSGKVTPGVLAARYKTNASVGMEASSSTMAVAEFQGEFFEERDLESFGASCHVPCDVKTVVGANRSQAGTESELDIEYIKAVAPEVPLTATELELAKDGTMVPLSAPRGFAKKAFAAAQRLRDKARGQPSPPSDEEEQAAPLPTMATSVSSGTGDDPAAVGRAASHQ